MKRWLPLLLTPALALGCAGCARRQTVTVYRIAKEGAAPTRLQFTLNRSSARISR